MRTIKNFAIAASASVLLSSCYSYTNVVGKGAQGTTQVKKWNGYLIGGLVPLSASDPKVMAAGTQNYDVNVTHSFVNLLVSAITFGIYSPTTTTVTK